MHPGTRLFLSLFLVSAVAACGPKTGGETDATSDATSDATTNPTATATAPTTTGAGVCEPFLDQPIAGPEVVVTIENTRDTVAFVLPGPACTSDPLLELLEDGEPVRFRATVCDFTCADIFAGDCFCAADCALAPAIRLEPGGVYTHTWSGAVFRAVTPPLECFPMECGSGCEQQQQAAAGSYSFRTSVGSEVAACADTPDLCMCTPGPEGWCALPGVDAMAIGGVLPIAASFAYPGETAVALVVE